MLLVKAGGKAEVSKLDVTSAIKKDVVWFNIPIPRSAIVSLVDQRDNMSQVTSALTVCLQHQKKEYERNEHIQVYVIQS